MGKLVFSHCPACAENDEGTDDWDAGVGCSANGPTDGCEAVWIDPDQAAALAQQGPRPTQIGGTK